MAPYCNYTFSAYLARSHAPSQASPPTPSTLYYSLNMGLVHLVALQAYCPAMRTTAEQPCLAPGSPQAAWLAADLARVDRALTPWVVVAWHQPFANSNKAHPMATEGAPIQAALEPILAAAGGVDLAFSGCAHDAFARAPPPPPYHSI